ncbi:5'-methylthioadenosine/S-adenosylhomocysteine nucleosidase [Schaalia sp. ZJ405]|uniref:5'-methylthioadenosine/S-adenosylhomocysteine nucleosidase n=1 Tax=Schaalia sp. ZJ405 TaxID=2709403 RepID=UPI001E470B6A|nr:5'-methylthioadenosine/S-adenosylhomocysteine nucleosidase [Schaalia sp. ZJ405]
MSNTQPGPLLSLHMPKRTRVDAVIQCAMPMEAQPFLHELDICDSIEFDALTNRGAENLRGQSSAQAAVAAPAHTGDGSQVSPEATDTASSQWTPKDFPRYVLGRYAGSTVLIVTSGIGLANSAAATARALMLVDTPVILAAGTTGGLARNINVGDIAGGIASIYGAADATAFGYVMGQVPQMPVDYHSSDALIEALGRLGEHLPYTVHSGRVVSSDSFITQPLAEPMRAKFPDAIAADMETAAMAQIAWVHGVQWLSLRAVSDLCGPQAGQDFHMDSEEAARHSAEAVTAFLSLNTSAHVTVGRARPRE